MQDTGVALAAIGVLATMTAGLIWALKFLLKEFNSTQRQLSGSIAKQAIAADNLNMSISKRDAREEEFHAKVMQQFDIISKKADRNYEAVTNMTVQKQNVETQFVHQEVVANKEVI